MKLKKHQVFLFGLALLAGMVAFAPMSYAGNSQPTVRTFRIEASQFAFDPGEISVNPGDTVQIELVSKDVVHGLYVDNYGISVTADPGQTAKLTFVADKAGSFRMRCNVTCGAMHPFMLGKLNVGSNIRLYRSFGMAFIGILASFVFFYTERGKQKI